MTTATATRRNSDNDTALLWCPMAEVWAEIVRDYPELRLGATTNAQYNFRQQHGAALIGAGILSRGMGRIWFLHRLRFKRAFPLLIAGRPLSELGTSEPPARPVVPRASAAHESRAGL